MIQKKITIQIVTPPPKRKKTQTKTPQTKAPKKTQPKRNQKINTEKK